MPNEPTLTDAVAAALRETLISPNEIDRNLEAANVVDGLFAIARSISSLAIAIATTPGTGANKARPFAEAQARLNSGPQSAGRVPVTPGKYAHLTVGGKHEGDE